MVMQSVCRTENETDCSVPVEGQVLAVVHDVHAPGQVKHVLDVGAAFLQPLEHLRQLRGTFVVPPSERLFARRGQRPVSLGTSGSAFANGSAFSFGRRNPPVWQLCNYTSMTAH